MKPAGEILAALRRYGHLEACEQIAKDHGTALSRVVDGDSRVSEVSEARHACWRYLVDAYNGHAAPVARIWGCHHTSILYAETRREIVRVVLASYESGDGRGKFELQYARRAGGCFGVRDCVADQSTWFQSYALAREVYQACTEGAGAQTFRNAASADGGAS